MDFTVTGVNPQTSSVTANATGQAVMCYQGKNKGIDSITGAVGLVTGSATKTWGEGGGGGGGGGVVRADADADADPRARHRTPVP